MEEQRQKIRKKFEKENEKLKTEGEKEMKQKNWKTVSETRTSLRRSSRRKIRRQGRGGRQGSDDRKVRGQPREARSTHCHDERAGGRQGEQQGGCSGHLQNRESWSPKSSKKCQTDNMQNYIDPRLTVVFSKKFDVPIEKFFSKTLREKFDWAIKSVEEDWEF